MSVTQQPIRTSTETEAAFASWFEDLLDVHHWRWVHFTPAVAFSGRVVTALRGSKGWPDYSITKGKRFLVVELKADGKHLTPEQRAWCDALTDAGVEWRTWRPADRATIMRELANG